MAKRRKKRHAAKTSRACVKKAIRFKTKRGRVISFTGRHGLDCAPRKFSHTTPARLRPWAAAMKKCSKKIRGRGKARLHAIGRCIKAAV